MQKLKPSRLSLGSRFGSLGQSDQSSDDVDAVFKRLTRNANLIFKYYWAFVAVSVIVGLGFLGLVGWAVVRLVLAFT